MALSRVSEDGVLKILYPSLRRYLCVDEVRPFLVQSGVITFEQCEELQQASQQSTSTNTAEKAVLMVSRHPQCASKLLSALEETDSAKIPGSSHHILIAELRAQLEHQTDSAIMEEEVNQGASNEPVPLLNYKPLKEKNEALRVKLAVESRRMLEQFTSFCIRVGDLLQSIGVTTDRVRALLQYRLGSKNISESSMKQVTDARSIHSLLCIAEPFVSWFNYDLIALLAKELGGEDGLKMVAEYEAKFQLYLQRLVFESPPFSSIKLMPSGFEEMTVKLEWNFEQVTIQDITIFKGKLCEFLHQSDPSVFILKSVDEGCVVLTWLIPSSIVESTSTDININGAVLLKAYPVVYFAVGPKVFDLRSQWGESKLPINFLVRSSPMLLTLHEAESERTDSEDSVTFIQENRLQMKESPSSRIASPTSDQVATLSFKGVPLRQKNQRRVKEYRKSSGYYSPVTSVYGSPSQSQRSSLVLDSAGKVSFSVQSSGYNSPEQSRSPIQLVEDEELTEQQHHQNTAEPCSLEVPWSNPGSGTVTSESLMIGNQKIIFTRPRSNSSHR